ncbi:MAG: hypothetical protein EXR62_10025 [Chloroflexi bacterium]|nr:hypothetical protein [Chloroflexota bacterium]
MESLCAPLTRLWLTGTGLQVQAFLINQVYEKDIKVSAEAMQALNIQFAEGCPRWNYTIRPRPMCSGEISC